MKPGCMVETDSSTVRIRMTSSDKLARNDRVFAMQAWLDRDYGYIENFCISCTNGDVMFPRQTVNFDNYKVTLPSRCTYGMEHKSGTVISDQIYSYAHDDANSGHIVFANGFEKFFKNVMPKTLSNNNNDYTTICPIESCKLMKRGCKVAWDGGDGGNIAMSPSWPFAITIKDNEFDGYVDQICVSCDNSYQVIEYDQLQIQQTGRCLGKLKSKTLSSAITSVAYTYDKTAAQRVIAKDYTSFVTDSSTDASCAITSCELRKSDCKAAWNSVTDPGVAMGDAPNYAITIDQKQIHGYIYNMCYFC